MATNEILQFAETDTGTNLLTQAEYAADSQRPIGNQPGVARSKLVNKALRQASLIAAGLAEYIADNQANNITDALTPQNIADYLQAAITGALGVTPPQFDNDTSLATTEFVQRALGNFSASQSLSANITLTAADAGKIIRIAGTGYTITLPLVSTVPDGAAFIIQHSGTSGTHTINRQGSDVIDPGNGTITSVTLGLGDTAVIVKASGNWALILGSASLQYAAGFGASIATSGYQKLPSGLIIQWGSFSSSSTIGNPVAVTFPLAFPATVRSIQLTAANASSSTSVAWTGGGATTTTFNAYANIATMSVYYIAIGY